MFLEVYARYLIASCVEEREGWRDTSDCAHAAPSGVRAVQTVTGALVLICAVLFALQMGVCTKKEQKAGPAYGELVQDEGASGQQRVRAADARETGRTREAPVAMARAPPPIPATAEMV